LPRADQLPVLAAFFITLDILLKIVLIDAETLGIMAPAATATKPAISAYSIKSWPRSFRQISNFQNIRFIRGFYTFCDICKIAEPY
jgi:hypothetical protein